MPRYIDRKQVCEKCNGKNHCEKEKCPVYKVPSADVVPKSEVESTENRCKELEQIAEYQQNLSVKRYFKIKRLEEDVERLQDINANQIEDIRLARNEVAREIFEEIEDEIKAAIERNYRAKSQYNPTDEFSMWVQGKLDALGGIEYFIAELKKKYIGGCDD